MLLSSSDTAAIRTDVNDSLPGTAVISRFSTSSDAQGGQNQNWSNIGTASCRISPLGGLTGDEEVHADRLETVQSNILTLPALTDIDVKDRVVTGGITYEVQNIRAPRSYEVSRRATVIRID